MFSENFIDILHDIKTPLNIIIGAIQLTEHNNDPLSEVIMMQAKHFQAIKHNSYRLLHLVNCITDLIKTEDEHILFNPRYCNIVPIVEELVQTSAPYAHVKGIHLEFESSEKEIFALIDVEKFERIILNLLSNAFKFTPSGGKVTVKVSCLDNKAYISVKDTGIGIPDKMQDLIFERFSHVGSPLSASSEGIGIGLSIAKYFTDLHKGKISLLSKEGEGSEFIIEIPINNKAHMNNITNTTI
ncbi:MAG TPA: HAMP domain-containing histidine kinase [Clostridiaceae bacterium]|nr:HAMP domain-containing histidine kinase [Clostridiaceae bacterium]